MKARAFSIRPRWRQGARIGLLAFVLAGFATELVAQDAFDRDAFLSRKKWYLSFTLRLKGIGETSKPDGDGGFDRMEWNIHREVSGVIELGTVLPGQFLSRHLPNDPAGIIA